MGLVATKKQDQRPEIPTTPEWRAAMREGRRRRNITQAQLAAQVGISQPQLSDIESGVSGGSSYVLEICRILEITPPIVTTDETDAEWLETGRLLRSRQPEMYELLLAQARLGARATESLTRERGDETSDAPAKKPR